MCIYLASGFKSGNMASRSSLSTLYPLQTQLDCELEEATTQQEKENLIQQYLKKLDEREDLKIPDFQPGKLSFVATLCGLS